jgi:hypothetical protein
MSALCAKRQVHVSDIYRDLDTGIPLIVLAELAFKCPYPSQYRFRFRFVLLIPLLLLLSLHWRMRACVREV